MGIEQDIVNKINEKKGINLPFIKKDFVQGIHDKVINQVKGTTEQQSQQAGISNAAEKVVYADTQFRAAVQELVVALLELGDNDLGRQLIGEHIMMLNSIFQEFEK
jgi:hypothetical protein